jgi:hypothetical protein
MRLKKNRAAKMLYPPPPGISNGPPLNPISNLAGRIHFPSGKTGTEIAVHI